MTSPLDDKKFKLIGASDAPEASAAPEAKSFEIHPKDDSKLAATKTASLKKDALTDDKPTAEEHNPKALLKAARLYFQMGQEANYAGGLHYYQRAMHYYGILAKQGNAEAQFKLAYCIQHRLGETPPRVGVDVDDRLHAQQVQNEKKVTQLYKLAAEQELGKDNDAQIIAAREQYGAYLIRPDRFSREETTVQREDRQKKGFNLLLCAAKKGRAHAQFLVGQCYEKGIGVSRDKDIAELYYEEAARQGHPRAQLSVNKGYRSTLAAMGKFGKPIKISPQEKTLTELRKDKLLSRRRR